MVDFELPIWIRHLLSNAESADNALTEVADLLEYCDLSLNTVNYPNLCSDGNIERNVCFHVTILKQLYKETKKLSDPKEFVERVVSEYAKQTIGSFQTATKALIDEVERLICKIKLSEDQLSVKNKLISKQTDDIVKLEEKINQSNRDSKESQVLRIQQRKDEKKKDKEFRRVNEILEVTEKELELSRLAIERLKSENRALKKELTQIVEPKSNKDDEEDSTKLSLNTTRQLSKYSNELVTLSSINMEDSNSNKSSDIDSNNPSKIYSEVTDEFKEIEIEERIQKRQQSLNHMKINRNLKSDVNNGSSSFILSHKYSMDSITQSRRSTTDLNRTADNINDNYYSNHFRLSPYLRRGSRIVDNVKMSAKNMLLAVSDVVEERLVMEAQSTL